MADIEKNVDLADDSGWKQHEEDLGPKGKYNGSLWSPPCHTFSKARKFTDGGPQPLRGPAMPDLLGLPDLKQEEKVQVRTGTLLAQRTASGIGAQHEAGADWIFENPAEDEDEPSIFRVPEVAAVLHDTKAVTNRFPQCAMNAEAMKTTDFKAEFEFEDKPPTECVHDRRWWRTPPTGKWFRAKHPPLKGKYRPVTPGEWEGMTPQQRLRPEGEYLTRRAAVYPSLLNCYLACLLVPRAIAHWAKQRMLRVGAWGNCLVRQACLNPLTARSSVRGKLQPENVSKERDVLVEATCNHKRKAEWTNPLRQPQEDVRANQERIAIGGMRRAASAVAKVPSLVPVGRKMRSLLEGILDQYEGLEDSCLRAIGSAEDDPGPSEDVLEHIRSNVAGMLGCTDWQPVENGSISTEIRAGLLEAWRKAAGDPDWAVTQWLTTTGVPAGLRRQPEDCGIFPRNEPDEECDPEEMFTNYDDFEPYASVEDDDEAWAEVQRFVSKRWLGEYTSLEEVERVLGEKPILSKFGLVIKMRNGKLKRRLILDSKSSGVSIYASKRERVILPRLLDIIFDILGLMVNSDEIDLFVLDFADAYWLMPLPPEERRWFVSKLRNKYFVFHRNAQGSRNAPLGWGRIAALTARLTQSMFSADEVRVEVYTDDPCVSIAGLPHQRRRVAALIILCWRVLGLPLSWRKGSFGHTATWIGGEFNVNHTDKEITVKIKQDIFEDSEALVHELLQGNIIAKKVLRKGIGKLSHIANLLVTWRPFMAPLYSALYSQTPTGAPPMCIWTHQIRRPLNWFAAFFRASGGLVERKFSYAAFAHIHVHMEIILDASPWGLAGILIQNGRCLEYFSVPITPADEQLFKYPIGSPDGQQVWESLAALIALRQWRHLWGQESISLRVKGDSVTMLTMIVNMRPTTPALALIGQEIALEFAAAPFVPMVAAHVPGIANVCADELSRWHQPGHTAAVPTFVSSSSRASPAERDLDYYLTLKDMPDKMEGLGMI